MNFAQQSKNRYEQSLVRGKNGKARRMSLGRKAGPGIGNFTNISEVNPNPYQKERVRQARLGAQHREWVVVSHTAKQISKLVVT